MSPKGTVTKMKAIFTQGYRNYPDTQGMCDDFGHAC